ncbi:hypothetical protein [Rickettsia endosymbiont of Orchestes rusci]
MIKSRHDTAFFQRSYSSGSSHGMTTFHLQAVYQIRIKYTDKILWIKQL